MDFHQKFSTRLLLGNSAQGGMKLMPPSPQSEDRPHQLLSPEQTFGNTQNQTQIPHNDLGWQWQGALLGLKVPEKRMSKRRNTTSKPSAAALWEI